MKRLLKNKKGMSFLEVLIALDICKKGRQTDRD
jgi:hypothetical protein